MTRVPSVLALLILLAQASAIAQQPQRRPTPQAPPKPAATGAVEFDAAPLPIPELGIQLSLPIDVYVDAHYFAGGRKRVRVASATWTLQIYSTSTPDENLTTAEVVDSFLAQRQAATRSHLKLDETDIEATGRLPMHTQREDDLQIAGRKASRAYVEFPNQANATITGYTVFKNNAGEFLVLQFDTPKPDFEATRPVYETIVATSTFIEPDPDELVAQAASVRAGDIFLRSITPDDIDSVLPDAPVYLRVYTPAPGGAEGDADEVAYQKVDIRRGKLGELDPERPQSTWTKGDREEGYLVRVDGRFLNDDQIIDMRAIMWLSTDLRRESAAVTTTATVTGQTRDGRTKASFQTLLERVDDRLTVNDIKPGVQPEVRDWVTPPDAYIPGVLLYLLPRLVIHKQLAASDLGFYHYSLQTAGISIRRDTFSKTQFGWERLEARSAESEQVFRSIYTMDGELVRNEWPNGTIMEPIEQDRLMKIWKSKGLPTR